MALQPGVVRDGIKTALKKAGVDGASVADIHAAVEKKVGPTILGKVHCEYFCFSGGSHTSSYGPVHNPMKHGYSAGGSSSGSAAVVGTLLPQPEYAGPVRAPRARQVPTRQCLRWLTPLCPTQTRRSTSLTRRHVCT